MAKRWKVTKKNGDVIVLRDVFEKIIKWVQNFQQVGNLAIYYAPSYAKLPWGVVSRLLQVGIPW